MMKHMDEVWTEAATGGALYKKDILENFAKYTGKHLRGDLCNFIKKEDPTQVFSCEFCDIFINTSFTEHLRMTTSLWNFISSSTQYKER